MAAVGFAVASFDRSCSLARHVAEGPLQRRSPALFLRRHSFGPRRGLHLREAVAVSASCELELAADGVENDRPKADEDYAQSSKVRRGFFKAPQVGSSGSEMQPESGVPAAVFAEPESGVPGGEDPLMAFSSGGSSSSSGGSSSSSLGSSTGGRVAPGSQRQSSVPEFHSRSSPGLPEVVQLEAGSRGVTAKQKRARRQVEQLLQQGGHSGQQLLSVLEACAAVGLVKEVERLLDSRRKSGAEPSLEVLETAVSACTRFGQWARALDFLGEARQQRLDPAGGHACNHALRSSCRAADGWPAAIQLLGLLHEQRVPRSSSDYAEVMRSSLSKTRERAEAADDVIKLWTEMEELGLDSRRQDVFVTAARACEAGRLWQLALDVLRQVEVLPSLDFSQKVQTSAVKACAKALLWQHAILLLMPPAPRAGVGQEAPGLQAWQALDVAAACSTAIACRSAGRWEEAAFILKLSENLPDFVVQDGRRSKIIRRKFSL